MQCGLLLGPLQGIMCPADPFGCRLSTVGLPMFPSEITALARGVGLVVRETVLGLYVGSVEGVGNAGAVDPFGPGAPPPPVVADPPPTAGPAAVCPLLPQPRGARHARSATARSCHCRNLSMSAPGTYGRRAKGRWLACESCDHQLVSEVDHVGVREMIHMRDRLPRDVGVVEEPGDRRQVVAALHDIDTLWPLRRRLRTSLRSVDHAPAPPIYAELT